MENKNIASDGIDWIVYDSFKKHYEEFKKLQEKSKKEELSPDERKKLTYHKNRIDCIKRFAKNKKVPVVYVPDECFNDEWQRPNSYGKDFSIGNPLFNDDNNWSELLYPKGCTEQNDKDALVLSRLPQYDAFRVKKNRFKYITQIDRANPYLPDGEFSVRQKSDVKDCWLLSIIIGIIDHDATYIPKKMVRDYPDNNQDKEDDDIYNDEGDEDVNNDIDQRPNKAVVRLHDEDGLPVDIVVDKTRPAGDKRPLWIIMLEKAVCVMMGINKFKNCYDKPQYQYVKGQRTVLGIDWNNIGSPEKDGSRTLSSGDIEKKFNMQDIDHGLESVGIQIILGKNNKRLDSNNKNNTVENIQQNLTSKKLVLIGTGNDSGDLKNADHVLYLKNINNDEMSTIDSISGKLSTNAKNNIKSDTVVHVSDFPDSERSIENEIDQQKINKIETDILGQKEDVLKANVTNNNKEKDEDNRSKSGIDSNKNRKSNNPYGNLELNNNNQVDDQDKRENNKGGNIYIANKECIEQINSNGNNGKSNNNKEKVEDNSSKFEGLNKDRKSNNSHVDLELNNNNQVNDQDKRENNEKENIYIVNKENIEQINSNGNNGNNGKSKTEETRNSSQSSSTQKPSNKFRNIGIAAIILGVLGFVITLIIKLLLIEALSLLVVILPPPVPIVVGIILIYIHKKFYTPLPNKIKAYGEQYSSNKSIQHTQERGKEQESVIDDQK